jgi:serine/threonine protein kinase
MCAKCLLEMGLGARAGEVVFTNASSAAEPPPSVEQLKDKFPQYEVLELIGRGGMGAVYRARQKGLDRIVALKVLPAAAAQDPTFGERFAREARALAKLNHANIIAIYDFGSADGLFYLVMEFVDGANLRSAIRAKTTTPRAALAIVGQICDALQYAHEEGIVHRDIKPENILLDKRGRVKIADFGLAKLLGGDKGGVTLTQTHQAMGTPHYMAPEQWEKPQDVDHRADIYSLGVVFYELLTGELPLGRFAPPSQKIVMDIKVDEIVLKTLMKEPELRYQHASEIKTAVTDIAAKPPPQPLKKRNIFVRFFRRILLALDPTTPGKKRLYGMELASNWLPLCIVGFLFLIMQFSQSDLLTVAAVVIAFFVIRNTKAGNEA